MHVDRRLHTVFAQRLTNQRTDREIRNVVIVHDIEMDDVGPRLENGVDFLTEAREVGRKNRGRDPGSLHSDQPPVSRCNASRYFSLVRAMMLGGKSGPGAFLFQSSVSR